LEITYNPTVTGIHDDILLLTFSGTGSPSKEFLVTGTGVQPLTSPLNVSVGVAGSTVTVSWDAVPGAAMYHVYSSDSPDGTFSEETGGNFNSASRENWIKTYSPIADKLFYRVTASDIVTDNKVKIRK